MLCIVILHYSMPPIPYYSDSKARRGVSLYAFRFNTRAQHLVATRIKIGHVTQITSSCWYSAVVKKLTSLSGMTHQPKSTAMGSGLLLFCQCTETKTLVDY